MVKQAPLVLLASLQRLKELVSIEKTMHLHATLLRDQVALLEEG